MRQAERDEGLRVGPTSDDRESVKVLKLEVREPRQANEILRKGVFCDGGARPPVQAIIGFIDDHRAAYGVEPICRVLPIAPSTYHPSGLSSGFAVGTFVQPRPMRRSAPI